MHQFPHYRKWDSPQTPSSAVLNCHEVHRFIRVGQHFLLHSGVFDLDIASEAIDVGLCAIRVYFSENASHSDELCPLPRVKSILDKLLHPRSRKAVERVLLRPKDLVPVVCEKTGIWQKTIRTGQPLALTPQKL